MMPKLTKRQNRLYLSPAFIDLFTRKIKAGIMERLVIQRKLRVIQRIDELNKHGEPADNGGKCGHT